MSIFRIRLGLSHLRSVPLLSGAPNGRSAAFLALFFAIAIVRISALSGDLILQHYDISDGLPQNAVTAIAQDQLGFIWMGTQDGVARFDGDTFRVFTPDAGTVLNVTDLAVTANNAVWVATTEGLFCIDADRRKIEPVPEGVIPRYEWIAALAVDENELYVAVPYTGVYRIVVDEDLATDLWVSAPEVSDVAYDTRRSSVVIARSNGLYSYSPQGAGISMNRITDTPTNTVHARRGGTIAYAGDEAIRVARPTLNDRYRIETIREGVDVSAIVPGERGSLWFGTQSDGLYHFSVGKEPLEILRSSREGLQSDYITSLFIDSRDVLWIATLGSGVHTLDTHNTGFRYLGPTDEAVSGAESRTLTGLANPIVVSIEEIRPSEFFVGTFGGGLHRVNVANGRVQRWVDGLSDPRVMGLLLDSRGWLWIGTKGGGLHLVKEIPRWEDGPPPAAAYEMIPTPHPWVYTIAEHPDGSIWAATQGGGIVRIDPETLDVRVIDSALSSPTLRTHSILSNGEVWVGTTDAGLVRLSAEGNPIAAYSGTAEGDTSLRGVHVLSIAETASGIWVGTVGGGLHRYLPEGDAFERFGVEVGLPNETVYGIVEDNRGDLWLSTNAGIAQFRPSLGAVVAVFDEGDGLQSNEFNAGAYLRGAGGIAYFGGVNGLTWFHPSQVSPNTEPPDVAFTGLEIGNRLVDVDEALPSGRVLLTEDLNTQERLILSQDEIVVGFRFAALHFSEPDANTIAYFLEGLEPEWNYTRDRRLATYTSLPHGSYRLRLKAQSSDGVWSSERVLPITVEPRVYQTRIFQGVVLFLLIVVVMGIASMRTRRINQRNIELKQLVRERTKELEEAQDRERSALKELAEREKMNSLVNLVARLAHRLNTPLGASITALSFAQRRIEATDGTGELDPAIAESVAIAHEQLSESSRLVEHLRQTIDLPEIESGVQTDLSAAVHSFAAIRAGELEGRGIHLSYHAPRYPIYASVQSRDILLILESLVENCVVHAFPAEHERPKAITVSVAVESDTVVLEVADTGVGMPEAKLATIVEPFERGTNADIVRTTSDTASGLGLFTIYTMVTARLRGSIAIENVTRGAEVTGLSVKITLRRVTRPV